MAEANLFGLIFKSVINYVGLCFDCSVWEC